LQNVSDDSTPIFKLLTPPRGSLGLKNPETGVLKVTQYIWTKKVNHLHTHSLKTGLSITVLMFWLVASVKEWDFFISVERNKKAVEGASIV
jgi:hypothetical protein